MLSNIVKHSYRAVDSTEFTAFSISKGMFMNLLKYKGKHIRVSDKSLVFRFSAGSLFLLLLAVDYAAEPKVNPHYGLEIGQLSTRWQRPFSSYTI